MYIYFSSNSSNCMPDTSMSKNSSLVDCAPAKRSVSIAVPSTDLGTLVVWSKKFGPYKQPPTMTRSGVPNIT